MHYERAARFGPQSILILDNTDALCGANPMNGASQGASGDLVRQERMINLVREWIHEQLVQIILVCRHHSTLDTRLFEIGYADAIVEVAPPGKE